MVTTIQISEDLKEELSNLKTSSKSTYEDVIKKTIKKYKESEQEELDFLKESYIEMYKLTKKISQETEKAQLKDFKKNVYE